MPVLSRLLIGLLLCAGLSLPQALADLGTSPAFIVADMDKNYISGTFVVTNTSSETRRYRANTTHFTFTEEGGVEPVEPDEYSLAEWIRFNPKEFTLGPKSSRKIRYTLVKPRNTKIKDREYWGAISFEPLQGRKRILRQTDNITIGYETMTNIMLPIFANMGDENPAGHLESAYLGNLPDGKQFVDLKISNTGEVALRLRGEAEITNQKGEVVARIPLPKVFVLPKHKAIQASLLREQLPKGDYQITLRLDQDNSDFRLQESRDVTLK